MTADERAAMVYERILSGVAERAGEMGRRPIASHWPHMGSAYRAGGLLYAGQALDGWDAPDATARWRTSDVLTEDGRRAVLARTRAWNSDLREPLWGVLQRPKRAGSSFWTLGRDITEAMSPGPGPWYSRIAWANIYPLGYDTHAELRIPSGPPEGALREVQDRNVGELFGHLVEMLDPARIVVVAGPNFWHHAERGLELGLSSAQFPLIRAGRSTGRSWVVGYHPGYARKAGARLHGPGTGTTGYYVERVRQAFRELESRD